MSSSMPARGQDWVVEVLREPRPMLRSRGATSTRRSHCCVVRSDEPPRPELRPELLLELGRVEAMTFLPDATDHLQQRIRART